MIWTIHYIFTELLTKQQRNFIHIHLWSSLGWIRNTKAYTWLQHFIHTFIQIQLHICVYTQVRTVLLNINSQQSTLQNTKANIGMYILVNLISYHISGLFVCPGEEELSHVICLSRSGSEDQKSIPENLLEHIGKEDRISVTVCVPSCFQYIHTYIHILQSCSLPYFVGVQWKKILCTYSLVNRYTGHI